MGFGQLFLRGLNFSDSKIDIIQDLIATSETQKPLKSFSNTTVPSNVIPLKRRTKSIKIGKVAVK